MASTQPCETSTREIICARIDNMMSQSAEVIVQSKKMYELLARDETYPAMRRSVVKWIKYVGSVSFSHNLSRDTSIQLFDRYFGSKVVREADYVLRESMVATVAVVSVVTSSKIHEFRPISMNCFKKFSPAALVQLEQDVLMQLQFNTLPTCSPMAFVDHFLYLYYHLDPNSAVHKETSKLCEELIGSYYEHPRSLLYAPSTIALSSLVIVFSDQRIDCGEWLRLLPDSVLPMTGNPLLAEHATALDVDGCVEDIRRATQQECRLPSPAGVHEVHEVEEFRPIREAEDARADENEAPAVKKLRL